MIYEVWTLDDRSMSFDEIERIERIINGDDIALIKQYWFCVESFKDEDEAYEYIESLDESKFPLIHDGKDFYL